MKEGKIKGKKWIIVVSVLILIAIVVTLIIVFLPKNPNQAIELLDSNSQTMFLKNSEDETRFKDFQNKVDLNLTDTDSQEVKNIYSLFGILNDVVAFYNQELVYAENNSAFQDNLGKVVRSLNSASSSQKSLTSSIEEVNSRIGVSDTDFIKGKWSDIRKQFLSYLENYTQAISGLNAIYQGAVPNSVLQNELTRLVLSNIDNYLLSVREQFVEKQALANAKRIEFFGQFVGYIKNTDLLTDYHFNSALQSKVASLNAFEKTCNSTFSAVINSIGATGFTFSTTLSGAQSYVDLAETFLQGGLAV